MDDGLGGDGLEGRVDEVPVVEIAEDEPGAFIYGGAVAFGEVVEDGDRVAGVEEFLHADGSDVAGTAGDEDIHGDWGWFSLVRIAGAVPQEKGPFGIASGKIGNGQRALG
jgi:hypothetical protein